MTIFNSVDDQTTCQVCGSKLSGQYEIGDTMIYLECAPCNKYADRNGAFYEVIGTIDEYQSKLEYLEVIEV